MNLLLQYRSLGKISITNYLNHEGSPYITDAPANVSIGAPAIQEVDASATLNDIPSCPAGFFCATSSLPPLPIVLTNSSSISYTSTVTNTGANCGQTATLSNHAVLVPTSTQVPKTSSASVPIYTGSCHTNFFNK